MHLKNSILSSLIIPNKYNYDNTHAIHSDFTMTELYSVCYTLIAILSEIVCDELVTIYRCRPYNYVYIAIYDMLVQWFLSLVIRSPRIYSRTRAVVHILLSDPQHLLADNTTD